MKALIVFHSLYGHIYKLALAIAEGVQRVSGATAQIVQVKETLPLDVLEKMHATEARKAFAHVPIADPSMLASADAILFGTPTRFGNMSAQMRTFLDQTGKLWAQGALVGKVGSVFTSSAGQHGGQETTITSFHMNLLHHGMVIVGVPYTCTLLTQTNEVSGGSPYGASTIAGSDGSRSPTPIELEIARFQGEHVAKITKKLIL